MKCLGPRRMVWLSMLACTALLSPAKAQDAGALRGPLIEETSLLDENGDVRPADDDLLPQPPRVPPPVFDDEPLPEDESADAADNDGLPEDDGFGADDRDSSDDGGNARGSRTFAEPEVGEVGEDGQLSPRSNTRAAAVQGGNANDDPDPYQATGIRLGSLRLFPVLEQTLGYTSNADFVSDGEASAFSLTDARIRIQSDWDRHELRGAIGGSYQRFFNGSSENLPRFDANAELRLDSIDGVAVTFGGTYNFATETATSDNLTVPPGVELDERPNVHRFTGFAQAERSGRKLSARLRGSVERGLFEDADLSDGSKLSQEDRNSTLFNLTGRLGYETSPAIQPFVEANIGRRVYDEEIDRNGNERSGPLYGLRGGVAFDFGEKLNGEIAVGYAAQMFDDPALETLDGVTVDGVINWSPQRFTTVTANLGTRLDGSTNADENGSIAYTGSLKLVRDVRPNLSLNALIGAEFQDFRDAGRQDTTIRAEAGAVWRLNRSVAITGTLGYERLESTEENTSYDAATARIGLRLQR